MNSSPIRAKEGFIWSLCWCAGDGGMFGWLTKPFFTKHIQAGCWNHDMSKMDHLPWKNWRFLMTFPAMGANADFPQTLLWCAGDGMVFGWRRKWVLHYSSICYVGCRNAKKLFAQRNKLEINTDLTLFSQLWGIAGFLDRWQHVGMWAGGFKGSTHQELEVNCQSWAVPSSPVPVPAVGVVWRGTAPAWITGQSGMRRKMGIMAFVSDFLLGG